MPVVPKPLAFLIAATLVVPPASPAGERRPLRVDDLFSLRRVSDPRVSPPGAWGAPPPTPLSPPARAAGAPARPPPALPLRARRDGETGPPPRPPRRRGGEGGRVPGGRLRSRLEPRRHPARPRRAGRGSRGDDGVRGGG